MLICNGFVKRSIPHALVLCVLLLAGVIAGCGGSTPTSPTSTESTTPAEATITEDFNAVLPVGGARFYSFTVAVYGTVNVTLASVGGSFVPSTVMLHIGLGQPEGTDCTVTTTITTAAGSTPQLTNTFQPGVYCVRVTDLGNLFAPATFSVVIAHS